MDREEDMASREVDIVSREEKEEGVSVEEIAVHHSALMKTKMMMTAQGDLTILDGKMWTLS